MPEVKSYLMSDDEADLVILALDNSKIPGFTCTQVAATINSLRGQFERQVPKQEVAKPDLKVADKPKSDVQK